jgi:hypothetical protein
MTLLREFATRLKRLPESQRPIAIKARKSAAYRAVFETPEGEIVLQDILREGGLLEVATVDGDPYATHFRDGKRALALHIVETLSWSESQVVAFAQSQTGEALGQLMAEEG